MKASYRITWRRPGETDLVQDGYRALNLLGHAEISGLSIPQACGGQAECGTCRVRIVEGEVTPPTPDEQELREQHKKAFTDQERLSCRARPRSDLVVELRGRATPDLRDAVPEEDRP